MKTRLSTILFILICCFVEADDLPRFMIKFPTRGRFEQFFTTLDLYYSHLSNKYPYHFVISCDSDDPVMNSPEAIAKLLTYPNLSFYFGKSKSKIEACNADLDKHMDFDVLILASDDMIPRVVGYDDFIAYFMLGLFPDYDGVLQFDDGFQHEAVNTFPIMGKKYFDRFGHIYDPSYKSLFCDNEMTEVSRMLNKCIYIDKVLIEHVNPWTGKVQADQLFLHNETYFWLDQQNYIRRRALNYWL